VLAALSLALTTIALGSQYVSHYLLPVAFFVYISLLWRFVKLRVGWLLGILLIVNLYYFPKYIYSQSTRPAARFENPVNQVIGRGLIDKTSPFGVIQIRKDGPDKPVGYEYRFFLEKKGYLPLSEFNYKDARVLYIFSEDQNYNITSLDSWEINQFGKNNWDKVENYRLDNLLLIKITKK
jgi:hypothetical protein